MLTKPHQELVLLLFKMADFRAKGVVNVEDFKSLISYCLIHSHNEKEKSSQMTGLLKAPDFISHGLNKMSEKPAKIKLNFSEFKAFMESIKIYSDVFQFIISSLNITQKVENYASLNLLLDAPVENAPLTARLSSIEECLTQEQEQEVSEKDQLNNALLCEGTMYRFIEGRGLKPYYYKLTNTQLFSFRSRQDREYKRVVYYGHDSYLLAFKTFLKASKTMSQIYCLEAASSDKVTQYFVTSTEEFQKWKTSLLKVMGLPGLFVEDIDLIKEIGEGSYGTVSKGFNLKSQETVAIKTVDKSKLNTIATKLLRQQIDIHRMCSHPNLVKLLNVYEDEQNVHLEMECLEGGSLSNFVTKLSSVSHWVIIGVLHQVAKALEFLKSMNIMHRDVKCQNILLTGRFFSFKESSSQTEVLIPQVKLADYGFATIIQSNEKPSLFCGTQAYMAPEVFLRDCYNFAADVYSLGVVGYYLANRKFPISSKNLHSFKQKLIRQEPDFESQSFRSLPRQLRGLIQSKLYLKLEMLCKLPEKRASLDDVLALGKLLFQQNPSVLSEKSPAQ